MIVRSLPRTLKEFSLKSSIENLRFLLKVQLANRAIIIDFHHTYLWPAFPTLELEIAGLSDMCLTTFRITD